MKITVSGVQRSDQTEVQSTRDIYQSTKNDYKHTCHTFVKLVTAKQKEHFKTLKNLLDLSGISMQRMNHMGFNINCFILCSSLGSFEILYQAYKSGRLKRICQTVFVTPECLQKLNAVHVDLSVLMEDGMINEYRDILLLRGVSEHPEKVHPADDLKLPDKIISLVESKTVDKNGGMLISFAVNRKLLDPNFNIFKYVSSKHMPFIQRCINFDATSCHDVSSTVMRRCIKHMCPMGKILSFPRMSDLIFWELKLHSELFLRPPPPPPPHTPRNIRSRIYVAAISCTLL